MIRDFLPKCVSDQMVGKIRTGSEFRRSHDVRITATSILAKEIRKKLSRYHLLFCVDTLIVAQINEN